jgi:hypothetical protein
MPKKDELFKNFKTIGEIGITLYFSIFVVKSQRWLLIKTIPYSQAIELIKDAHYCRVLRFMSMMHTYVVLAYRSMPQ